jgi:hypothetical protein
MLLGITIWFNKMQPLNKFVVFCAIVGIEFNIVCTVSSRRYVLANAASAMDVIVVISSKIISSNLLPLNALSDIIAHAEDMVTLVKTVLFKNALARHFAFLKKHC